MFAVITYCCCLALLTLFGFAAWTDRNRRIITNWTSLAIILLFFVWLAAGYGLQGQSVVSLKSHLIAAAVTFAISYGLWIAGLFGGGDVKLLTGVALWAGTQWLAPAIILIALSGAILALLLLGLSRFWPYTAQMIFGPAPVPAGMPVSDSTIVRSDIACVEGSGVSQNFDRPDLERTTDAEQSAIESTRPTLPYGIAIVIGGGWVVTQIIFEFGIN